MLIASIVVNAFYIISAIAAVSKVGESAGAILTPATIASCIALIVMLVVNIIYFKNRSHIFVN